MGELHPSSTPESASNAIAAELGFLNRLTSTWLIPHCRAGRIETDATCATDVKCCGCSINTMLDRNL